MTYIVANM